MTSELPRALTAELLKARRSRVPLITFLVLTAVPLAGALFIYIVEDPERARRLGLLGAKAELAGITADWDGLLLFTTQAAAAGLLIIDAFVLTWLHGREFVDGTARYLMALPIPRATIVAAKLVLYAAWSGALVLWLVMVTTVVGVAMGLPGGSSALIIAGIGSILRAGLLTILTVLPVAYVASRSRGYLAALASALGLVVVGQIGATLGWGAIDPWAVPALAAGVAPDQNATPVSFALVVATGALGVVATVHWWRSPDAGL